MPFRSHRVIRKPNPSATRLVVAGGLAAILLLAAAVGASANPSISEKRAQAEAVLAEIQTLDEELGAAAERFNGANYELGKLTAELAETREDLTRALQLQKASRQRVAVRLRQLYMSGESGTAIEVILGARSLDDLLDRVDLAQRVSAQDAEIAREAKALRERVAKREKELAASRERQASVVGQRAAEKQAIEGKLGERQRLLASVKDEIARMVEAERQRQAELQRQAALELERQRQLAEAQQRAQIRAAEATKAAASSPTAPASPSDGTDGADGDGLSGSAPSVDYTPPPADASKGAQVVAIAMQYLGVPYVWGGASPSGGFDCSGLTMYVFAKIGVSLPHYAAAQYQMGSPVSKDQLQPGDLVFFRGLGHMGMYIGGGNMIHAPHTGDVVKISPLSDPYYVANWVGARRVL